LPEAISGEVALFDVPARRRARLEAAHVEPVTTIALSDDAGWAAAAGGGGALVVSDARGSIHGTVGALLPVPARVALKEKDR
jgi:hypothetical protein